MHPRRFGFVDSGTGESVFVPPPLLAGFVDSDVVSVSVSGPPDRLCAETIELRSRSRRVVCGEVAQRSGSLCVVADPHIATDVWRLAAPAATASGFPPPAPGDLVVGDLAGGAVSPTVVVPCSDLDAQLRTRVLVRYSLPLSDPSASGSVPSLRRLSSSSRRRDLRSLTTFTIDADHSADLDDALSVLPADSTGAVRVLVHISDVAEHVPAGSRLDVAAAEVATSVYLPGWTRPMLPRSLSEQSLSLLPGLDRDTLTVEFRVEPDGTVSGADVFESRICSDVRLSYDVAAEVIANRPVDLTGRFNVGSDVASVAANVEESLRWLRTAAARLASARARRGGLDARRVDPELRHDAGVPAPFAQQGVAPSETSPAAGAHALIERLMVAANEAVAGWLTDRGLPGVFRVHDGPDSEAAERLEEFCAQLGFAAGFAGMVSPHALAALDAQFTMAGSDTAARIWDVLLASMPPASYSVEVGQHFGLGSDAYVHFTSPIRRYADVCVHRVVKAYLAGYRDFDDAREDLSDMVGPMNVACRAAARAEGQLRRSLWMRVVADAVAKDRTRVFSGRVSSVDDRGARVVLESTSVWGRLAFSELGGSWTLTSPGVASSSDGRVIAVGETVKFRVAEVDPIACSLTLTAPRQTTNVRRTQRRRRTNR